MPKPRQWWAMRPGPKRELARAAYYRHYDRINQFRAKCKNYRLSIPEGTSIDIAPGGNLIVNGIELIDDPCRGIIKAVLNVRANSSELPG